MKIKIPANRVIPVAAIITTLLFIGTGIVSASQNMKAPAKSDIEEQAHNLMRDVERLRGLDFLYDLPVDLVSQEEMAEIIEASLDEDITPEKDYMYTELYVMLGLMEPNSSLREAYQSMIEEQIGGLYDQHEKRFYVVDLDYSAMVAEMFGDLGPFAAFAEGFMQGMGYDINAIATETVIIHELTHALDDQHFDIESAMEGLMEEDSDDAQLAYQSLVEGNATRLMNNYMYSSMGLDSSMLGDMSEMTLNLTEDAFDYDPFLTRLMVVPYFKGEEFINHLVEYGGIEEINRAFNNPPESMEQILHPERYIPSYDAPSDADIPDLSAVLPDWEHEVTDTLGELLLGMMFEFQGESRRGGENIADGWDYDVVTAWRSPDDDLAIALVTIWDDRDEAEDFFDAYLDLLEYKYPSGSWEEIDRDYGLYIYSDSAAALEIDGRLVVIVEGVPADLADSCLYTAWPTSYNFR